MKRILVTGSRDLQDRALVYGALQGVLTEWFGPRTRENSLPWLGKVVIVHGACPTGADMFALDFAISRLIDDEPHPAQWGAHGRAAGPIRNREMVAAGADLCLAFPLEESRGTEGTINLALAAGIPVRRIVKADARNAR